MKNYAFYVSYPIINEMVDLNNQDHVKLIKYMKELGNEEITKSQASKARRLIRKALGESGQCGIHFVDLTFRECKHITMKENNKDLASNCKWVDVSNISI